jgi:hypothetical protein
VTRLDPLGVKRVMDVGGPSPPTKAHKFLKAKTHKEKLIGKATKLAPDPKHKLRPRRHVESDTSSSDNSESELLSVWAGNKTPTPEIQHAQNEPFRAKSVSPVASPSGNQNVTVTADVHCSQGGTKAAMPRAKKPASSSVGPADPPNVDDITEVEDFTVIKAKMNSNNQKAIPTETVTPPSPTPDNLQPGGSQLNSNHFLSAPRQKIPPVVIHHHFQGDMTRLNKDFHSQYQPLGFTTYRMKAGIACQTSTYRDYLNLQTFLKQHKVPFNLIKHNTSKPYRVVIKGIPPTTPPKAIQDELLVLGFSVQNVIPMTAWRDKTPLPMHIIELDNVPQSQKISQLTHLCYIKISVEPYKGRTVPPQCARCQQFYHVAANCHAPPACSHCAEEHCSWQCDRRFEPNFVPTCALCKMGEHGSKYRGCPYFRSLMEKESRNKPATLNTKQLNAEPPTMDRRQSSFQSTHQHRPPLNSLQNYPPPINAWTKPLNFSGQPYLPPRPYTSNQPRDLPSNYSFAPHPHFAQLHDKPVPPLPHKVSCACSLSANKGFQPAARNPQNIPAAPRPPETGGESNSDVSDTSKSPPPVPRVTKTKQKQHKTLSSGRQVPHPSARSPLPSTEIPTCLRSEFPSTIHTHGPQPAKQRLGNSHTAHQTEEFINCVRAFNPNFSFQLLLQSFSSMLQELIQHPYESALPIILNTFFANLLSLPHNG